VLVVFCTVRDNKTNNAVHSISSWRKISYFILTPLSWAFPLGFNTSTRLGLEHIFSKSKAGTHPRLGLEHPFFKPKAEALLQ